ncbi:hypothetical protein GCM10023191_062440 [Actinoallomurus oryzae]|jgi:hypothetical protein|uniref:DUF1648 domain-containing protein n=1 Tax=Actinoallomurus oryzae TaxID=502180 RepID=A0ABP8QNJ7_9ACTN
MTTPPETPAEQRSRPPADESQRRNLLAVTAATFAVLSGLDTFSSLMHQRPADWGTDYAVGRLGAPLPFALVALACGIPALLRTRRPADRTGRSWGGREPASVAVVVGALVTVVAVIRIALFLGSR